MTDLAHYMFTAPATEDRPQQNTCLRCGAHTEGPLLPELPCAAGKAADQ